MNAIAARLKERREAAGLSQGQVAEYEGISQSYLSDIERGRNQPAVWPLLARFVKRYRTSADYVLGITDDPTPAETRDLPDTVREILIVALQLSDRRRVESLHLMQALLSLDQMDRVAVAEELAEIEEGLDAQDAASTQAAVVKLLEIVSALSGVETDGLVEKLQLSGPDGK